MPTYTTLVDADTLSARLADPRVVIVDCRFELANTESGERAYADAHIPGAVYAHLDRDLSGVKTGANGRHPLPEPDALRATFGRLGISTDAQVIAYDQDSGMYASRLWWLLRWMGHRGVAVLDGGFAKWTADGRPTVSGVETRQPRTFAGQPDENMTVDAAYLLGNLDTSRIRLVDARAPERYRGDIEPLDPVAGHIPGAVNHFYMQNLEGGRFREREALRKALRASIGDVEPANVVCYCGSGVTACQNLLALEHAGLAGARLYPGSWSEWVADRSRPTERG